MSDELIKCKKLSKSLNFFSKALKKFSHLNLFGKSVVILTILITHVIISWLKEDFTWLASAGALLSVAGLFAICYESFLSNLDDDIKNIYLDGTPDYIITHSSTFWGQNGNPDDKEGELLSRRKGFINKYQNIYYYLYLTIFGTLLWAYAGFLNFIFNTTCN